MKKLFLILIVFTSCYNTPEEIRLIKRESYIVGNIKENGIVYVKDDRHNLCFGVFKNDDVYNHGISMFSVPCDSIPEEKLNYLNLK